VCSSDLGRVGTAFAIERSGEIFQAFEPKYAAYATALAHASNGFDPKSPFAKEFKEKYYRNYHQQTYIDFSAVQVELCNWGYLENRNGTFYNYVNKAVTSDRNEVQHYAGGFKGYEWYQKYTDAQIESLRQMLLWCHQEFKIPLDYHADMWDLSLRAIAGEPGVWSHTSYLCWKSDAHPQPELVEMLKSLKK